MPINFLKNIIQQENAHSGNGHWIKKTPSRACAAYIENFYLFYGIERETEHWIFNDGFPSILLFPEKENRAVMNIQNKTRILKAGWVDAGIIKKGYVKFMEELGYILVIRFRPENFHTLFSLEPSFFRRRNIATLPEINFSPELLNGIFATPSVEKRIDLIEEFITSLIPADPGTGLLNSAIELINRAKGHTSVAGVVKEMRVNYKWLERNFSKNLGINPKEYIQLQRFISAYIHLYNRPDDLLSVAITNGYYDYNHFLKEFKDFTGKTPLDYISFLKYNPYIRTI